MPAFKACSIAICLISISVLTGCASPQARAPAIAKFDAPKISDLERVWRGAVVALPVRGSTGSMVTTNDGRTELYSLTGAGPETRWPVILILSGCRQPAPVKLMRAMAEQGFVAISPDSQGRFFDPLICPELNATSEGREKLVRARQTEISFSRNQLRRLSWADTDNFFLLGLYDGAAAVARYAGHGFKARVLAEWGCQGDEKVRGIANERLSPVFAATSSVSATATGDCSQFLSKNGKSQVLVLPSKYSSNILLEPIVYTQLLHFIDRQLFK